ncbi:MAG TPA: hypothetical protein VNX46_16380 [Candidatus Acidoferrum sp.]|jgi:hypothetical protein|nr:hypothetical protein [Candidatus Acidoferrum sp.]
MARRRWSRVGGAMVLATILVGCGHKPTATAATQPASSDQSSASAASPELGATAPGTTPVTVAAALDGGADLRDLNHAYIGWIVQTHQRPRTFEEYVAASGVKVPPPPAGKKYVIDHAGFIAIQNQ